MQRLTIELELGEQPRSVDATDVVRAIIASMRELGYGRVSWRRDGTGGVASVVGQNYSAPARDPRR